MQKKKKKQDIIHFLVSYKKIIFLISATGDSKDHTALNVQQFNSKQTIMGLMNT